MNKHINVIFTWLIIATIAVVAQWKILNGYFPGNPSVSSLILNTDGHGHALNQLTILPNYQFARSWDLAIFPIAVSIWVFSHIWSKRRQWKFAHNFDFCERLYLGLIIFTMAAGMVDKVLMTNIPQTWPIDYCCFYPICALIFSLSAYAGYSSCKTFGEAITYAPAITISVTTSVFIVAGMEYGLIIGVLAAAWMVGAMVVGRLSGSFTALFMAPKELPGSPSLSKAQ